MGSWACTPFAGGPPWAAGAHLAGLSQSPPVHPGVTCVRQWLALDGRGQLEGHERTSRSWGSDWSARAMLASSAAFSSMNARAMLRPQRSTFSSRPARNMACMQGAFRVCSGFLQGLLACEVAALTKHPALSMLTVFGRMTVYGAKILIGRNKQGIPA